MICANARAPFDDDGELAKFGGRTAPIFDGDYDCCLLVSSSILVQPVRQLLHSASATIALMFPTSIPTRIIYFVCWILCPSLAGAVSLVPAASSLLLVMKKADKRVAKEGMKATERAAAEKNADKKAAAQAAMRRQLPQQEEEIERRVNNHHVKCIELQPIVSNYSK